MVDIRVDLETLTGLTENPGELAGFGPVIADIARRVTAEQESAEWRWTVVDDNNQVIHTGITIRRPTTACNLAPLCRHHHRAKHQASWKPTLQPNGDHTWLSRLGHTYTTSGRSP